VVFEQTCRSASACAVVVVATNVPPAAITAAQVVARRSLVRLRLRLVGRAGASFMCVLPPHEAGGTSHRQALMPADSDSIDPLN
jgi:hypothetical protein